jgi:hypothetical protein
MLYQLGFLPVLNTAQKVKRRKGFIVALPVVSIYQNVNRKLYQTIQPARVEDLAKPIGEMENEREGEGKASTQISE